MFFKRFLAVAIIFAAIGAGLLLIRFVEQATQSMAAQSTAVPVVADLSTS